jgi:hypothetical protein
MSVYIIAQLNSVNASAGSITTDRCSLVRDDTE